MAKSIRIKASAKGSQTEVKALISHSMETGLRKDKKTGKKIPAHFIQEVICEHNGAQVMKCNWSVAVSKNPYLAFKFSGGKAGDAIKISWTDNMGKSDSAEAKVK